MTKQVYENVFNNGVVKRKGYKELVDWLDQRRFFNLPATLDSYHTEEGGLSEHAAEVHARLVLEFVNELTLHGIDKLPPKMEESIAIIALFHDLHQIDTLQEDNGTFKECVGQLHMPNEQKTLFILNNFMQLTSVETEAIMFIENGNEECFKHNSLALLAHCAHKKAVYLDTAAYKSKSKAFSFGGNAK